MTNFPFSVVQKYIFEPAFHNTNMMIGFQEDIISKKFAQRTLLQAVNGIKGYPLNLPKKGDNIVT